MSILKSLFRKNESSCCNVKIEEIKEDVKPQEALKIVAVNNLLHAQL
jgi:pimeloyl-CoA synthetase